MTAPDFTKLELGPVTLGKPPSKADWPAPEGIGIKSHYGPSDTQDLPFTNSLSLIHI